MTTFAYRLILDDGEAVAVQAALAHYLDLCKSELADGPKAPYWAHHQALLSVEKRLRADRMMTSTSTFTHPGD